MMSTTMMTESNVSKNVPQIKNTTPIQVTEDRPSSPLHIHGIEKPQFSMFELIEKDFEESDYVEDVPSLGLQLLDEDEKEKKKVAQEHDTALMFRLRTERQILVTDLRVVIQDTYDKAIHDVIRRDEQVMKFVQSEQEHNSKVVSDDVLRQLYDIDPLKVAREECFKKLVDPCSQVGKRARLLSHCLVDFEMEATLKKMRHDEEAAIVLKDPIESDSTSEHAISEPKDLKQEDT